MDRKAIAEIIWSDAEHEGALLLLPFWVEEGEDPDACGWEAAYEHFDPYEQQGDYTTIHSVEVYLSAG